MLLSVLDDDGNSRQFSTVKDVFDQSMNPMAIPTIKFSQEDKDLNGLIDMFKLEITLREDPTKVRQI